MRVMILLAAFAMLATGVAGSESARAAPQVLALVTSDGPVPLRCEGGDCAAELSAFCLQPERSTPAPGTTYLPPEDGGVRLVGTTPDGRRLALDPAELRVAALRGHVAVRLSLPERRLAALGVDRVSVEVGPRAVLVPRPQASDAEPQTAADLERVRAELRPTGDDFVDRDGERMVAARSIRRMVNLLPAAGRVGADRRRGLWRAAAAGELSDGAAAILRNRHDYCQWVARTGRFESLRRCLESQHDGLMESLANDYRAALGAGG